MVKTRSGKNTKKCTVVPININTNDSILDVIQNYKDGGISIMENINEET